jgi:profilin
MSWQAYIDTLLKSASCIKKGAIIGLDGSVWARSDGTMGENFNASAEECKKFTALWDNIKDAPMKGFHLEGAKYIVPSTDGDFLFGKSGPDGVMAIKTKMAVILAVFSGAQQEGVLCRKAVEHLADYLSSQGY